MNRSIASALALGTCILVVSACNRSRPDPGDTQSGAVSSEGATSAAPKAPVDLKSVAAKVIGQAAEVRENEIVELSGNVEDLPLLEDMAIEIRKRGAHPIVLVQSEQFSRRSYDEVPAKYDSQAPVAYRKLTSMIDVFIGTEAGEGRTLRGVPPERVLARGKAFQPLFTQAQKRGVRMVSLGNGLYPSEERAEQMGMDRDELASLMYGGVDADYEQLQATGAEIEKALRAGKELRITSPDGTDLKIRLASPQVYVSDGIISAEDRKRGGAALSVWLPAGEVYFTVAPGTADGILVADRYYFSGDRIDGLRLEIKDGRVVGMSAKAGLDPLKARYDKADAGHDLVGVVDFGINSSLKVPEGSAVNAWSRAGAVTVGIGNNQWAGGSNLSDFGMNPEVARATVTVDGKPIVENGKLVVAPTVASR